MARLFSYGSIRRGLVDPAQVKVIDSELVHVGKAVDEWIDGGLA